MDGRKIFYLLIVIAFTVSAQSITPGGEGQADKPLSVAADSGVGSAGCGHTQLLRPG
jgi:hypothetical protein